MLIFRTLKRPTARMQAARLAALVAAISALLVAAPASAETEAVDGVAVPSAPAAESVASSAEELAPTELAEQPQASAAAEAVSEPIRTQEVTSAAPTPDPALEETPAAVVPADPAAPIDRAVPPPPAIADSATTATTKIVESAGQGASDGVVPASKPQVQISELADGIRQDPARSIATVVDRIPALVGSVSKPTDLLASVTPATAELPAIGSLHASGEAREDGALNPGELPRAALLSRGNALAITPALSMGVYLAEPGGFEIAGTQATNRPGDRAKALAPAISPTDVSLGERNGNHFGSPAPSDIPSPAPEAPVNAASSSGGTSFVPLVALLALLALAAPTALRRLGKAADFRAPTPFVCALERPG